MISIYTVYSFQDINKFQISSFQTFHWFIAEQSKKTERGMMRVTV